MNKTYTPINMNLSINHYSGSSFFSLQSYQRYDSATHSLYLNALVPGTNLVTIPSAGTRLIVANMQYDGSNDFYNFVATGSISDVGNGITQIFQVEQVTIVAPPVSIPPVNISSTLPVISGDTPVGSTLTSTNGSWNGFPAPTFTYNWYRGLTLLSDQTNNTYVTQAPDLGQSITCRVIGANASGSSFATSNTITPTPTPPVNTSPPIISTMTGGVTGVGSTLKTTNGSWDGIPASTFTYQWYFKTTSVSNATPIPGEINDTYTIVTTSIAVEYTCRVRGTNVGGSSFATSNSLTIQ
jgi:hypothetical protein